MILRKDSSFFLVFPFLPNPFVPTSSFHESIVLVIHAQSIHSSMPILLLASLLACSETLSYAHMPFVARCKANQKREKKGLYGILNEE